MKRVLHLYVAAVATLCLITSCGNYQNVMHKPKINDGITYGRKDLPPSQKQTFYFGERKSFIEIPQLHEWADRKAIKKYLSFDEFMTAANTTAFLVVRNDSILFEKYYNGYSANDITQIFSITKPLTASLLSQAVDEGFIQSLDTPVSNYMDIQRRKKKSGKLTLRHLGQMQSGINHNDYWRWLKIIRFYHSKNADDYIQKVKVFKEPGKSYKYKSIDTQLLGTCMEDIFGEEDLLNRFVGLYWHNIGPEHKGYYSLDHPESGNLKYYGGLNISARDLAKIGKIYLNNGAFEGKQVIDQNWMHFIRDTTNHVGKFDYCMGWYFDEMEEDRNVYYGSGFNGQLLVINEDTNTIIVRLGESKSGHEWYHILSELSTLF